MVAKLFYLLGEDPSTAKEIDISSITDEDELRHTVSAHFAIVEPRGRPTGATVPQRLLS
jgi:hypothetical protein